jgi:hypothetical protein
MYPIWLISLAILCLACAGYGRFKQHRPLNSLWRLA